MPQGAHHTLNLTGRHWMDIETQKAMYLALLHRNHDEQTYQSFLERRTRFIPREFVQNHGIGLGPVLLPTVPSGV